MKKFARHITLVITVLLVVGLTATAQRPDDRQGPPGGPQPSGPPPGGPQPFGPPGGFRGPPGFHLMTALDADNDGKISTKEIDNAVAALLKLDKNKDGKLSPAEIGWPPAGGFGGGRGRGGFPGGPGGPGPGGPGGPGNARPQRPDSDTGGADPTARRQPNEAPREPRFFSRTQLKSLDRNEDGKITKDEIPTGLQKLILGRVDTNKDDVIDAGELSKVDEPRDDKKSLFATCASF